MSFKNVFKHWLWGWTHHYPWAYVRFKLNQGWKARRSAWPSNDIWAEAVHPHQELGGLSTLTKYVTFQGGGSVLDGYIPTIEDMNTDDWTVWR